MLVTMLAVLTPWGLAIWSHGTSAPLWRALVSPATAVSFNWFAVLVIAACYAYSIRKLVFPRHRYGERLKNPLQRLTIIFGVLPLFVVPPLARQIATMSPFYFSLLPCALSFALMLSQTGCTYKMKTREGTVEVDGVSHRTLRLFLSGVFAAIGAWEGVMGLGFTVFMLVLPFYDRIRNKRPIPSVLLLWLVGFLLAFFIEGCCFGWPWNAMRFMRLPVIGMALFLVLSVVPLGAVRQLGMKWWLMGVWGLLLGVMTLNVLSRGEYWEPGPCEAFVRKVLADLGDRQLIIGDGLTDEFFRVLKPEEVRLVGTRTLEDREFLISFFGKDEPVSPRALIVRNYYHLPETEPMMATFGVRLSPWAKKAIKARQAAALTPAVWEAMRAQAETNALRRILAMSGPVVRSVEDMLHNYENIPLKQRPKRVREARSTIRKGWVAGMEGATLSTTAISLDVMLNDWTGAEMDALTALTVDRDDPAANAMLGALRLRKRNFKAAETYLRKGVRGGGSGAYNDYAMLLLLTDRAAKAEDWARLAVKKAPNNWNFRETLVQVLTALKMADEAMHELQEAERLAKEAKVYDLVKEKLGKDRNEILRLRSVSSDKWGQ